MIQFICMKRKILNVDPEKWNLKSNSCTFKEWLLPEISEVV